MIDAELWARLRRIIQEECQRNYILNAKERAENLIRRIEREL